jgi:hypothetical protein
MAAKKKAKRTVLYSSAGKKLYAKRDAGGKFKDIQSYQRAHAADLRQTSKSEVAAKAAPKKKVAAKKVAAKKAKTPKKSVARKAPARKK